MAERLIPRGRYAFLNFITDYFLSLISLSCRYSLDGIYTTTKMFLEKRHGILAFWHRDLVGMLSFFFRLPSLSKIKVFDANDKMILPAFLNIPFPDVSAVMVSASRDGEIVNHLLKQSGFSTIRGSSGTYGLRAAFGVLQYFKTRAGFPACVIMIADGSRGPACEVQRGIPFLARLTKSVIIPCASASFPSFSVPSWDRMIVPIPFSRIGMCLHARLNTPLTFVMKKL
jgi:lysophospholipid acyltransferase (LPLAT)-like uncharacterized protein